jgi:exopolysaccharide biosynthesis polyprenyl glycosylphosphotransferase
MRSALAWVAGILHSGAQMVSRWAEREGNQHRTRTAGGMRNVLIVGAGGVGQRLAKHLAAHPELGRSVCGLLDDRKLPGKGVMRTSDLAELSRAGFVDEVILAGPHDREKTLWVVRAAQQLRLDVKMVPDLFGCEPTRQTERIAGIPLICLHEERLPVTGLLMKRMLDVAGAGAALILIAPVLTLLTILVRLDSPGPALYAALRAGRKGRPFRCYKFRTMVRSADTLKEGLRERNQREGPFFKVADDPRITRVGRLLRRYSLDELPQLWNVLKGEMSLVGPRPHPLDDFSAYSIEHLPRLDVIPGMTGLWQITARQNPSFQAGMDLDIEYIHRWSLGMDLKILLKTAAVVLRGSGE